MIAEHESLMLAGIDPAPHCHPVAQLGWEARRRAIDAARLRLLALREALSTASTHARATLAIEVTKAASDWRSTIAADRHARTANRARRIAS